MKIYHLFTLLIGCITLTNSNAQKKTAVTTNKNLLTTIQKNLDDATKQYSYFLTKIPVDKMPKTLDSSGNLVTSTTDWWCSGFYPGTLLYLSEETGNKSLYNEAIQRLKILEKEQYNTSTHDLGFMMYCSFGKAHEMKPSEAYKQIILNSAKSLVSRFNAKTGAIRSWDSKKPTEFLVIIDNMMNLELLFNATKLSGDSSFYKIAVTHANTTLKNHFRENNSSYHVVDYNSETGLPNRKITAQGTADASAWARGQAWGLYGYTMAYRETSDKRYLEQANKIASFILNHPNLPKDLIPYWDFDAPGIPNALRDASAAAVIASGLVELARYTTGNKAQKYIAAAERILTHLSDPEYKAATGENGGFLLKHSVGNMPRKSEIDVPLTYADYYYVEAMSRYKHFLKINKN